MIKPVRTWIVIADGARARILSNDGAGKGVQQVEGADFRMDDDHASPGSDRSVRTFDAAADGRHAMEPAADRRRESKQQFLSELADYLRSNAERSAYDRLVILAPSRTLGDLRQQLPETVKRLVVAEQARDLTPVPNEDMAKHLRDVLAV